MESNDRINPSDDAVREGFDQTNSLAGDQLGESDGTVDGEVQNESDRDGDDGNLLTGKDDNNAENDAHVGTGGDFLPPGNTLRGGAGGL